MNPDTIAKMRLVAHQLARPRFTTVVDVVKWMGAIQAQDFEMAKWAIGARLPNSAATAVQTAVNTGAIIRTHILRPTWHLVAAEDVRWMLTLTAPHILSSLKAAHRAFGLTPRVVSRCNDLLEQVLGGGTFLNRDELIAKFKKVRIPTGEYRVLHLLLCAELAGLICSGPAKNGKPTYALLDERVPVRKKLTRDESLAELGRMYFTGHSPATLEDFRWWSGLPAADSRRALELIAPETESTTIDSRTYWMTGGRPRLRQGSEEVHVLPAFDEFIIGYRERSAVLPRGNYSNVVSSNGIFRPVIVVGGKVAGLWRRTKGKDSLEIEVQLFKKTPGSTQKSIERAFTRYANFTETRVRLVYEGRKQTAELGSGQ